MIVKAVVVSYGSTELKRYRLNCEPGAGEAEETCHDRILLAARLLFEREGFDAEQVRIATFRLED
jgi:hypothetical protein